PIAPPRFVEAEDISGLVVSVHDPAVMYLTTRRWGVLKSTDAGRSWKLSSYRMGSEMVTCLVEDPAQRGVLYAGTANAGLYRPAVGPLSPFGACRKVGHEGSDAFAGWRRALGIAKDSGSVEKRPGICPQASRIGERMKLAGTTRGNDFMIEVTDLTKSYGHVLANDRISFSVRRGEIVGLLGPNGAGKT